MQKRHDEQTDKESISRRNFEMKQRFIKKYGIDYTDERNYDLIINTDNYTPIEISEIIILKVKSYENSHSN